MAQPEVVGMIWQALQVLTGKANSVRYSEQLASQLVIVFSLRPENMLEFIYKSI